MLLSTVDILDRFQIVGDRIHSGSRRAAALLVDVFLLDLQIELGHQLLGCVTAKEGARRTVRPDLLVYRQVYR